jgi:transposase
MISSSSYSQALLPNPDLLILERIEREANRFRLTVRVEQEPTCPQCGTVSRSRHSLYSRRLQDLPWQGVAVELWVIAGRFRCRNISCPRQIFCERLPQTAHAYGRQTARAAEIVRLIGYVAGGLPGQRLLVRLAIATSDDTVRRRVREQPSGEVAATPIRHLGVDDWAWRQGQAYGTILVDLDLHRVIDLLPERTTESFSAWLGRHPEIVTIARDRGGLYAEGAARGAPQAQQVADRFHLLVNLSATMERVLEEHSRQLIVPAVAEPAAQAPPAKAGALGQTALSNSDRPPPVAPRVSQAQLRRQRRLARYQQVVALSHSGQSQVAISRALGIGRKTIRRWLRRGEFPERKPPHRAPAKVSEFANYLQQRWRQGCHNASRLYQELRQQGYRGKRGMVARLVAAWRKTAKATPPKAAERLSPRHAALLVTRPADQITDQQQQLLDRLARQCPAIIDLRKLALGFRAALAADDANQLRGWIDGAQHSEFGPLVRFAYGLQRDISAVAAAVTTSWSSGQVEGQINRLKTIKRQMYGRAGFELLRARVLPYSSAATAGPAP